MNPAPPVTSIRFARMPRSCLPDPLASCSDFPVDRIQRAVLDNPLDEPQVFSHEGEHETLHPEHEGSRRDTAEEGSGKFDSPTQKTTP